ncbi:WG repeat-containing protein [Actinoplanes sp. NPDC051475]|uniref:WG repeat-containing protein n=1 Tax=Actinoplanes sp. NPDC051475 TaxID=3157225 RepID=UPI00344EF002
MFDVPVVESPAPVLPEVVDDIPADGDDGPGEEDAVNSRGTTDRESTDPDSTDPDSAEPVNAEPVNAAPISATPVSSEPTSADPVSAAPTSTEPVSPAPTSTEPVSAPPTSTEPVSAPPTSAEPVGDESGSDESIDVAPVVVEVVVGAPISGAPVDADGSLGGEIAGDGPNDEVVEAEIVDDEEDGEAGADAGRQPVDVEGDAADEGRGLGWLLSMSGLGAVTPPADSAPVSPAPVAPVSAPAAVDAPVSPAPVRTDWFSPSIETEVVEPRTASPEDTAETPDAAAEVEGGTVTEVVGDDVGEAASDAEETADEAEGTEADARATDAEDAAADVEDTATDPAEAAGDVEEAAAEEAAETDPVQDTATTQTNLQAPARPETATAPDDPQLQNPPATPEETPVRDAAAGRTEKAVRAPSMQLPTLSVAPPPEPELEPERRLADPEQLLAAYPWKVDPVTLRETADEPEQLRAVRDRLTDKLEYAERDAVRARLLSVRAVVSRVLGEYGRALADGREALRHAEATGELRRIAIVQARLAHVQQWRGDYAEADRLYEEANSVELPGRLRAEMHVHAGTSCYEQGRYLEACNHFELALELRRVEDPDLVARTEAALDAVMARVQEAGWGPYPRTREEILQQSRPPQPAQDYETDLFGYADSNGDVVIPEVYAEAQPFHEGAAWVRRPDAAAWELIDESGTRLLDDSSAYLQALPFSDGLAWVSRDPAGGWFAVDWHNRVIVPGGFDEVRPFRRGVAAVRRGGWGALDRHGRIVVQLKYRGFATALTAGGTVDGFTEEGLAVVDAGGRFGVVDRTGRLPVPPVHAEVIIHPVAYVIRDEQGSWGALDRKGEPIVDVAYAKPADVVREIDRLLSDTRPVL